MKDDFADVRINVVSNLSGLVEGLGDSCIEEFILPAMMDLAKDTKWRVRMEVVAQSGLLGKQIGREAFEKKFQPLVLASLSDHVFSVRERTSQQVAELVKLWGLPWASQSLLPQSLGLYDKTSNYLHRVTSLMVAANCSLLVLSPEELQGLFLPLLLKACKDPVANVRFFAVKSLTGVSERAKWARAEIRPVIEAMTKDADIDVRYFAECTAQTLNKD